MIAITQIKVRVRQRTRSGKAGETCSLCTGMMRFCAWRLKKIVRGLGLNPIVLKNQANEGMTLIQKFEKNSDNVCFVIVLLTADDESTTKKDGRKELHARQNVVFEMGYFFHVFRCADGAHRGLFAILENGVTKPGDIDGLVYQAYSKGDRSWVSSLIKELDAVAYVRFASVYREFKDVNTFMNELKKILDR